MPEIRLQALRYRLQKSVLIERVNCWLSELSFFPLMDFFQLSQVEHKSSSLIRENIPSLDDFLLI